MIRQELSNIWVLFREIVYRFVLVACLLLDKITPATDQQKARVLHDAFRSLPF